MRSVLNLVRVHRTIVIFTLIAVALIAGKHFSGMEIYRVTSGSMMPAVTPDTIIVTLPDSGGYAKGDIITVSRGSNDIVTHRVHEVTADGYKTKGDANVIVDPITVAPSDVTGRVVMTFPGLGNPYNAGGIALLLLAVWLAIEFWLLPRRQQPVDAANAADEANAAATTSAPSATPETATRS